MANYWRYFRLDDDPHVFGGTNLFTVCIHHGGRFYSRNGVNKVYRGGEIVYVDGVDKDKLSVTGFNYWAHDLGYLGGSVGYWFRIPGSESGTGYLPIVTDADCLDMVQFIPEVGRLIHVYIVCLAGRRYLQDYELDRYDDEMDHLSYIGHTVDDMWLEDDVAENVEDEAQDFGTDGEQVQEGSENVEEEVHMDSEDEYMPEEVISVPQTGPVRNRPNGLPPQERQRRGSHGGHASTSRKMKDKGKEKVVEKEMEGPKKRRGRPKRDLKRRYSTRGSGEGCSQPVNYYDSDSSDDSDDPNFEGIVDSDFELNVADDEVEFQTHVDGDPSNIEEWEDMRFNGTISEDDGTAFDGFPSMHGSSDESGEDVGMFPVKGKKRFSEWKEFNKYTDMQYPIFELGMVFPNSVVFKKAMRKLIRPK